MPDELKIILEDVKEKFDTGIEGIQMINEKWTGISRKTKKNTKNLKWDFWSSGGI